jgi:hypothetical protein
MLGVQAVKIQSASFTIAGISPNPSFAGQAISLNLATDTQPKQARLMNGSGQQWSLPFSPDNQQVQLPTALPAGLYFLQVYDATGQVTLPLMVAGR